MAAPSVTVQVEFTAGVWTAVTSRVDMESGITINGGRPDVFSQPGPTVMNLTLTAAGTNGVPDGQFVPNNPASAYWPNVKRNKRIRVNVTGSSTVQKFIGYIDNWLPIVDAAGEHVGTSVAATDRQKFLARTALRPLATVEAIRSVATGGAVWTFTDVPGSQMSSLVGGHVLNVQPGTDGSISTYAEPPEGMAGAVRVNTPGFTGPLMWGIVPDGSRCGFWFRSPAMSSTRTLAGFLRVSASDPAPNSTPLGVVMTSGVLSHRSVTLDGRWDDDAWHFFDLKSAASDSGWTAYIDGVQVGTAYYGVFISGPGLYWCVGGSRNPATGKTSGVGGFAFGDIVINTSSDWAAPTPTPGIVAASRTGLARDLTSGRFDRYAQSLGFTAYTAFTGIVPVGAQDTSQGFLAVAQELAAAEGSWVEIDHTTGNLRFGERAEQITATVTVDADGDLVGGDFTLDDPDNGDVNAVAVVGSGGTYTATDDASIAVLGRVEDSGQTIAADLTWVRADAEHRLAVKNNPLPRLPKITIDLLAPTTAGLLDACLTVGVGSRIKVTGLASWLGRTIVEQITQGWQWTISQDVFTLALDAAPPENGINLDDDYRGKVAPENGALTLSASLTSGATSCTVASTTGNLLTTAGGGYPSWITIDGEDIKVTAVSGGASPQTLTIVRAEHGTIAAAHSSGAVVRLRLNPALTY